MISVFPFVRDLRFTTRLVWHVGLATACIFLRYIGRGHTQRHIFACLPISVDGASLGVSHPLELPIDMQPVSTLIYMCFLSIMLEWGSALLQLRFLGAVRASAYHLLHHARALRLLVAWSNIIDYIGM